MPPGRAPVPSTGGWHFVDWGCEFLGTALLLLGGLSAVVLDFGAGSPVARVLPSHSLRLLLTGTLFGSCGALVTISPLGRRSGAHLNPAVTLAFWCHRHLRLPDLFGYVVSQAVGALVGTVAVRLLWGHAAVSVRDGLTMPGHGFGPLAAAGLEAIMTAGLVLTIFVFVSSPRTAHWTPLAVTALIAVARLARCPLHRQQPQPGTQPGSRRRLSLLHRLLGLRRRPPLWGSPRGGRLGVDSAPDAHGQALPRRALPQHLRLCPAGSAVVAAESSGTKGSLPPEGAASGHRSENFLHDLQIRLGMEKGESGDRLAFPGRRRHEGDLIVEQPVDHDR